MIRSQISSVLLFFHCNTDIDISRNTGKARRTIYYERFQISLENGYFSALKLAMLRRQVFSAVGRWRVRLGDGKRVTGGG